MIGQSLCHYLESQLTEYYRLIAVLESQMQIGKGMEEPEATEEDSGLTLKRLEVWIDEWRLRLRMVSACVEGCRDLTGGALVNLIHSYTENGDPFVRKVTDELLEEVSKPFFVMLHRWLFSGELYDPFSEFFVHIDPELANAHFVQHTSSQQNGFFGDDASSDVEVAVQSRVDALVPVRHQGRTISGFPGSDSITFTTLSMSSSQRGSAQLGRPGGQRQYGNQGRHPSRTRDT